MTLHPWAVHYGLVGWLLLTIYLCNEAIVHEEQLRCIGLCKYIHTHMYTYTVLCIYIEWLLMLVYIYIHMVVKTKEFSKDKVLNILNVEL